MRLVLTILFLLFSIIAFGQLIITDSSVMLDYKKTEYVPRVSISQQKSFAYELGISKQWITDVNGYNKYGWNPKASFSYLGVYLSGEAVVGHHVPVYGARLGAEAIWVGGSSTGIILGMHLTDYVYESRHYPCFTPGFVLPLDANGSPLFLFSYGYCINNFSSSLSEIIGDNRISLVFNLGIGEHKRRTRVHEDFDAACQRIKNKG